MADRDLLIVGCGPAALSCAITARKRGLNTLVAGAPSASGWLRHAERIDNYPGLPGVSGQELLAAFESQARELGTDFVTGQVRLLQPAGDEYMALIGNDIIMTRAIVLAIGAARPAMLPGEEALLGQGVSWCGTCDGMFYRGRKVAVLSYWDGGSEEARFLAGLCSAVDYYVMLPHDLPTDDKVTVMPGKPSEIIRADNGLTLKVADELKTYDGVFIFRPSVAPDHLLPGLKLDGPFIHTDRRMSTGIPHVYACGDCTGKPLQIAKAVGEGNIAAITAAEELMS